MYMRSLQINSESVGPIASLLNVIGSIDIPADLIRYCLMSGS